MSDGEAERLQYAIERNAAANERLEVQRGFRQQLQDIQRQFQQSAQDAERSNDAQAFLQAVRARDEQIDLAKSERDVSLGDVGRGAQQQRADLKEQLAQIEEAFAGDFTSLKERWRLKGTKLLLPTSLEELMAMRTELFHLFRDEVIKRVL